MERIEYIVSIGGAPLTGAWVGDPADAARVGEAVFAGWFSDDAALWPALGAAVLVGFSPRDIIAAY